MYGGNQTPTLPRVLDYYMHDEDLHRILYSAVNANGLNKLSKDKSALRKLSIMITIPLMGSHMPRPCCRPHWSSHFLSMFEKIQCNFGSRNCHMWWWGVVVICIDFDYRLESKMSLVIKLLKEPFVQLT